MNLCDNLNFIPNKKQFKWNGDLNSLKDLWIAELEEGKIESLLNVESKGSSEILKFETVTVKSENTTNARPIKTRILKQAYGYQKWKRI